MDFFRGVDDPNHPRRADDSLRRAGPRKPHRHGGKSDHADRQRSGGGRRSRTGKSRMLRQSPVEERLSVHEDDSMSDAFDDDGLFQIDENFAKFLDDKTSCQK